MGLTSGEAYVEEGLQEDDSVPSSACEEVHVVLAGDLMAQLVCLSLALRGRE